MRELIKRNLYLCVSHREDMARFLVDVLEGGVDIVQLREKVLPDELRLKTARLMAPICRDFSVPFIMNDSPELALQAGADGVHVGQDDVSVARCRDLLGDEAIVGLSTHSDREFDAALLQATSYLSAGPIEPTPTKVGRAGTGIGFAVGAQARSDRPVFVTGGVNKDNIGELVEEGLRHFVVVRAICDAANPKAEAQELRRALNLALA